VGWGDGRGSPVNCERWEVEFGGWLISPILDLT